MEIPSFTIPSYTELITEHLETLIRWKEFAVLGDKLPEEKAKLQRLAKPEYAPYLHIQEPGELDNEGAFFHVWRRKDWDNHYAVQIAKKQRDNEIRHIANERTEKIAAIGRCIKIKLSFLEDEAIRKMATDILDTKNFGAAETFGWKGEF